MTERGFITVFVILVAAILVPGLLYFDRIKKWVGQMRVRFLGNEAAARFEVDGESDSTAVKVRGSKRTVVQDTYKGAEVAVEESEDTKIQDTGKAS